MEKCQGGLSGLRIYSIETAKKSRSTIVFDATKPFGIRKYLKNQFESRAFKNDLSFLNQLETELLLRELGQFSTLLDLISVSDINLWA